MLDVDHVSNGAWGNELLDLLGRREVPEDMAHRQDHTILLTRIDDLPTVILRYLKVMKLRNKYNKSCWKFI